jgi:glycerol-3-phosphate dehydrogenase
MSVCGGYAALMADPSQPVLTHRPRLWERLDEDVPWDVLVIGGGATGLGCAVDAASRGYRTALVERADFASGTSSRSTKIVHGGVRYLQQGDVKLVVEALRERGRLRDNAPHLVRSLPFVIPAYRWHEPAFYGVGLRLYDRLAGKRRFGRSRNVDRERTLELLPTLKPDRLRGGIVYHDGQFDDARVAVSLAQTAADQGAVLLNHVEVVGLEHDGGRVAGAVVRDRIGGAERTVGAAVVINATGVFADNVLRMDRGDAPARLAPSQGTHVVLPRDFMPGEAAMMLPETDDGRVLFAIPWQGVVVVGTTDVPVDRARDEPTPLADEVQFLLEHAGRYLTRQPEAADVLSVFAGLRPLVRPPEARSQKTKSISRDHTLHVSDRGLVTIIGGKWTTYRLMAEDAINKVSEVGRLSRRPCRTKTLQLHAAPAPTEAQPQEAVAADHPYAAYGTDAEAVQALPDELQQPLHPRLPYTRAQVVWAARHEWAQTVQDVLARRTRSLLIDVESASDAAPTVAHLLAEALGHDAEWERGQVQAFRELAAGYRVPGAAGG